MKILEKLDMFIGEEGIVTGDVETNKTQGNVDIVGGKCKEGYVWCPNKKACIPMTDEECGDDGEKRGYTFHRSTNGRKKRKSRK